MNSRKIAHLEDGATRDLPEGSDNSLAEQLSAAGLPLNTRCGGHGLCRGCEVHLREGTLSVDGKEAHAPAAVRACRAYAASPAGQLVIDVPNRSRIEHKPQVGETFEIAIPYAHQPLFASIPGQRDTGFAVDIGTTTVVVLLVDLETGEVLSRAGGFNEQIRFGDNVVTRIAHAKSPQAIAAMQCAIVNETIAPLLARACEHASRSPQRIAGGAIAGNTTMLHLLVGEDPSSMGVAPFTPRFVAGCQVSALQLTLALPGLSPETPIQLLPSIAAYIGADITAGVYATGMMFDAAPSLLIDIGTNGEIVLQNSGKLTACATAAGPAFEGCGLCCGTRAKEGAVSDVCLSLDPFLLETQIIGRGAAAPSGEICGSAYLDFLAQGRQSGLLGASGRFDALAWGKIPPAFRCEKEGERAILLAAPGGANARESATRISEVDVALLLQAKAAIGAGIETLLETAGIRAADLGPVYLAGGFGMHLNVAHAIAIGLLPGFREEQIQVVGNTALAGALLALVDRSTLGAMEAIRRRVDVIDLNLVDGFEDRYIDHLALP